MMASPKKKTHTPDNFPRTHTLFAECVLCTDTINVRAKLIRWQTTIRVLVEYADLMYIKNVMGGAHYWGQTLANQFGWRNRHATNGIYTIYTVVILSTTKPTDALTWSTTLKQTRDVSVKFTGNLHEIIRDIVGQTYYINIIIIIMNVEFVWKQATFDW